MLRDVYSGNLRLKGEENGTTLLAANNYAFTLIELQRVQEAKALMRKVMPVARRVLGESDDLKLRMRWTCARALCEDPAATLDDLRVAVTTLEETTPTARRVLGGAHPITGGIEECLRGARATLHAHETGDESELRKLVEAMTIRC